MDSRTQLLDALRQTKTVALKTYRRDGREVVTPVNVAVRDGHAYFRTPHTAGKVKRLRNDPRVALAPTTYSGRKVTGPEINARARRLGDASSIEAGRALRRAFPIVHGVVVPIIHRARKARTLHYELEPPAGDQADSARG